MRLAVIALVIIVIARPQNVDKWQSSTTEGIDIVMALDVSGSMLARDFSPDRLEASKNVATEFMSGRPEPNALPGLDRIGRLLLTRLSERIFAHGPTAARLVADEFGVALGKISLIDHGHWVGSFAEHVSRSEARRRLELPSEGKVFLSIGGCKRYRNLLGLIEAFKSLGVLRTAGTLVIAGKFQEPEYRQAVERAISGRGDIRLFPQYIPDDELQNYLISADVVVLPYLDILTSGAAVLALSFGRPVVAPRKGCLIDLVDRESGILYEPTEPASLVGAMRQAIDTQFDSDVIKHSVKRFSWQRSGKAFVDAMVSRGG